MLDYVINTHDEIQKIEFIKNTIHAFLDIKSTKEAFFKRFT